MGIKKRDTGVVVADFLRSNRHRQLILDADEIQLFDSIVKFARRHLGDPPILSASAICDIQSTIKREILALDEHKTNDPRHSAFELFSLTLFRHRKGIVFISDLESIDAECLIFLANMVDAIIDTKSEWKVVITGIRESIPPFCLHKLGLDEARTHNQRGQSRINHGSSLRGLLDPRKAFRYS